MNKTLANHVKGTRCHPRQLWASEKLKKKLKELQGTSITIRYHPSSLVLRPLKVSKKIPLTTPAPARPLNGVNLQNLRSVTVVLTKTPF